MKKRTKGILISLGIASTIALSAASAVNLGISANNELGAGTSVTASCQPISTPISVGFDTPTYVPANKTFTVSTVNLGNIAAACNGKNAKVVVSDSTGASLGTYSGTISGTSIAALLSSTVDSSAVAGVSVVIY